MPSHTLKRRMRGEHFLVLTSLSLKRGSPWVWGITTSTQVRATCLSTAHNQCEHKYRVSKLYWVLWLAKHLSILISVFLTKFCYFLYQVNTQLYSQGWVDHVPDLIYPGFKPMTSGMVVRHANHYTTQVVQCNGITLLLNLYLITYF